METLECYYFGLGVLNIHWIYYFILGNITDCLIFMLTVIFGNINVEADNMVSYLHRYTISKLKRTENIQIIHLIRIPQLRKPEMPIYDLFTLGVGIVATVKKIHVINILICYSFVYFR